MPIAEGSLPAKKKKKKTKVTSIREIKFTNATVALFLGLVGMLASFPVVMHGRWTAWE